jgi:hypothetical protein
MYNLHAPATQAINPNRTMCTSRIETPLVMASCSAAADVGCAHRLLAVLCCAVQEEPIFPVGMHDPSCIDVDALLASVRAKVRDVARRQ